MRRLVTSLVFFLSIFLGILILLEVSTSRMVSSRSDFKFRSNAKFLVLGHSHPECALNDTLIPQLFNGANSGEGYFYTYLKSKQLLKQNPQIETVFVEFTNNHVTERMNAWIWEDKFMVPRFPDYSSFMSNEEKLLILSKNYKSFPNVFSISLKKRFERILAGDYRFTDKIGGYLYLVRDKTDSLVKVAENQLVPAGSETKNDVSERSVAYLKKIVHLCQSYGKRVVLIRSPQHEKYSGYKNEAIYKDILKREFANLEYLAFSRFPLRNDEFGDLEHLNFRGARIFSIWFNSLLTSDLLVLNNKQEFIDEEIRRRTEVLGSKFANTSAKLQP